LLDPPSQASSEVVVMVSKFSVCETGDGLQSNAIRMLLLIANGQDTERAGSFFNLWAVRFDGTEGKAVGAPFRDHALRQSTARDLS
jgi:hypothetical protein